MAKKLLVTLLVFMLALSSFVWLGSIAQAKQKDSPKPAQNEKCCQLDVKWEGKNPNGDKLEEGKSAVYKLVIANKCKETKIKVTLKATQGNPKFDHASFTLEPGKSKTVAVKLTMPKKGTANSAHFRFDVVADCGKTHPVNVTLVYKSSTDECCKFSIKWEGITEGFVVEEGKEYTFKLTIKNECAKDAKYFIISKNPLVTINPKVLAILGGEWKTVEVTVKIGPMPSDGKFRLPLVIESNCSGRKEVALVLPYKAGSQCCDFSVRWEKPFDYLKVEEGKTYILKLIVKNECETTQKIKLESKFDFVTFVPAEFTLEGKKEATIEVKIVAPKKGDENKLRIPFLIKSDCGKYKEMHIILYFGESEECCYFSVRWEKPFDYLKVEEGKTYILKLIVKNECEKTQKIKLESKLDFVIFTPAEFTLEGKKEAVVEVKIVAPKKPEEGKFKIPFVVKSDCGKVKEMYVYLKYEDDSEECCYFSVRWEKPFDYLKVEEGKTYILKLIIKNECDKTQKISLQSRFEGITFTPSELTLEGKKEATIEVKIVAPKKPEEGKFKIPFVVKSDCGKVKEMYVYLKYEDDSEECCYFSVRWEKPFEGLEVEEGKTYILKLIVKNECDKTQKISLLSRFEGITFTPSELTLEGKKEAIVEVKIVSPKKPDDGKFKIAIVAKSDCGKTKEWHIMLLYKKAETCCKYTLRWDKEPGAELVEGEKTYEYKLYIKNECEDTIAFNFQARHFAINFSPNAFKLEGGKEQEIKVTIRTPLKPGDDGRLPLSFTLHTSCGGPKDMVVVLKYKAENCCNFTFKWLTNPESVRLAESETGYVSFQITNNCGAAIRFTLSEVAGLGFDPPTFTIEARGTMNVKIKVIQKPRGDKKEKDCRWVFVVKTECGENKEVEFRIKYK